MFWGIYIFGYVYSWGMQIATTGLHLSHCELLGCLLLCLPALLLHIVKKHPEYYDRNPSLAQTNSVTDRICIEMEQWTAEWEFSIGTSSQQNAKPQQMHFPSKEQIHSQEASLAQPVLKYLL